VPTELVVVAIIAGAAAFGAMLIALVRRNRRGGVVWGVVWLACVLVVGGYFVSFLAEGFWFGGAPTDTEMERLVAELDAAYPDEIEAIGYENALPLNPPALFIDLDRAMTVEIERAFICRDVRARVDVVDSRIVIFGSGITDPDDCP